MFFEKIMTQVSKKSPLVHNITNYVTVNDCANVELAAGGSPIMADCIEEVEDITSICSALVINIGTLNERTIPAMIKAGKKANELSHPVILDPVGAGASALRTETAMTLLKEVNFSVIRGNISEIKTLYHGNGTTQGVDADIADKVTAENLDSSLNWIKDFSKQTGSVIAVTGAIDIITDSNKSYAVYNGHSMMSSITGSGCMLSALIGVYCGGNPDNILEATATAICLEGLAGEMAYRKVEKESAGNISMRNYLIDFISNINYNTLKEGAKIEAR